MIRSDDFSEKTEAVRTLGANLLRELDDYLQALGPVVQAINALDNSWEYSSSDNHRTEIYFETVTDSKGNSRQEMRTRQVYDSTDHSYTYHEEHARAALQEIRRLFAEHDLARFSRPGIHGFSVDIKSISLGELSLIRKMVIHTVLEDAKATPTDEEIEDFLNMWIKGTNIDALLAGFTSNLLSFEPGYEARFRDVFSSNPSYYYRTSSRSDSGPLGYQRARGMESDLRNAYEQMEAVRSMIKLCMENATRLDDLHSSSQSQAKVDKSIDTEMMDQVVEAYLAAFPDSEINIDQRVKHGKTALVSLIVGAVVAGLTFYFHPNR